MTEKSVFTKRWAIHRSAWGCTQFADWGLRESARVEPVLQRVDLRRAASVAAFIAGLVRVAHFVRTLKRVAVIGEEGARLVGAIDHEERET